MGEKILGHAANTPVLEFELSKRRRRPKDFDHVSIAWIPSPPDEFSEYALCEERSELTGSGLWVAVAHDEAFQCWQLQCVEE